MNDPAHVVRFNALLAIAWACTVISIYRPLWSTEDVAIFAIPKPSSAEYNAVEFVGTSPDVALDFSIKELGACERK